MRVSVSKGGVTAQQEGVIHAQPKKFDGTTMGKIWD